jgi:hypothetical protein
MGVFRRLDRSPVTNERARFTTSIVLLVVVPSSPRFVRLAIGTFSGLALVAIVLGLVAVGCMIATGSDRLEWAEAGNRGG